ncbi:MAG: amidohydrolase family protein [Desulfobacterales bacterium]|nr:amidohydrolase family protein [Desulfobacterales bacterium]
MFDVHFHWYPKDLLELARKAYPQHHFLRLPFEDTEAGLRYMDAHGIRTALVDWGAHLDFLLDAYPAGRSEGCRVLNERAAELTRTHPGRFLFCAAVDALAGERAVSGLEGAVGDFGAAALGMQACFVKNGRTVFPHDKSFWPLYAKAEQLGLPVFVHPMPPPYWPDLPAEVHFMGSDWGFLLGNLLAINLMAGAGVFDAFPKLSFIFCQLGGFFPVALGRSDLGWDMQRDIPIRNAASPDIKLVRLRDYAGRFFVDIHSMDAAAIRCAADTIGADHILFSTDFPITSVRMGAQWHLEQVRKADLGQEATRAIISRNALSLFPTAGKG